MLTHCCRLLAAKSPVDPARIKVRMFHLSEQSVLEWRVANLSLMKDLRWFESAGQYERRALQARTLLFPAASLLPGMRQDFSPASSSWFVCAVCTPIPRRRQRRIYSGSDDAVDEARSNRGHPQGCPLDGIAGVPAVVRGRGEYRFARAGLDATGTSAAGQSGLDLAGATAISGCGLPSASATAPAGDGDQARWRRLNLRQHAEPVDRQPGQWRLSGRFTVVTARP